MQLEMGFTLDVVIGHSELPFNTQNDMFRRAGQLVYHLAIDCSDTVSRMYTNDGSIEFQPGFFSILSGIDGTESDRPDYPSTNVFSEDNL